MSHLNAPNRGAGTAPVSRMQQLRARKLTREDWDRSGRSINREFVEATAHVPVALSLRSSEKLGVDVPYQTGERRGVEETRKERRGTGGRILNTIHSTKEQRENLNFSDRFTLGTLDSRLKMLGSDTEFDFVQRVNLKRNCFQENEILIERILYLD